MPKSILTKYPKLISRNSRFLPSIECGPGWHSILNTLFENMVSHVESSRDYRADSLRFNRCLRRVNVGNDQAGLVWYFSKKYSSAEFIDTLVRDAVSTMKFRMIPTACQKVELLQVKEKFGTLRIYYSGGDDMIRGMVSMAESLSTTTCQQCGNPASLSDVNGWLRVECQACQEKRK